MNIEEQQKQICQSYQSDFVPVKHSDWVILAGSNISEYPIIGCRIMDWDDQGKPQATWCISCGEISQEETEDLISVEQLQKELPQIMPFLALDIDFNFIIQEDNSVEVWRES